MGKNNQCALHMKVILDLFLFKILVFNESEMDKCATSDLETRHSYKTRMFVSFTSVPGQDSVY